MKLFQSFLFVCFPLMVWAQQPNDAVDIENFNADLIAELVQKEINRVRDSLDLATLSTDDILYKASLDHCQYLAQKNELTHYQKNAKKRTPKLRAEYYGAINYAVGENIVSVSASPEVVINGQTLPCSTYTQMTKVMVLIWMNSPPHWENITAPDYRITGVAVSVNPKQQTLICTQTFGVVYSAD
jgi:uncharacterized protein YkwD